ncbi:MAG: aminotransferase class IV [Opitutales bacterium]
MLTPKLETFDLLSPAIAAGAGLFETCALRAGGVAFFQEHWERLAASAGTLGLSLPLGREEARAQIRASLEGVETQGQALKLVLLEEVDGPRLLWHLRPLRLVDPAILHRLNLSTFVLNERSVLSGHKTLNYWPHRLGVAEAGKQGFFDSVILNSRGKLAECWTSNLFLVRGTMLYTPALQCGPRPGIIRQTLLEQARTAGLKVKEAIMTLDAVRKAEAIFLTNSLIGIEPISHVSISGEETRSYESAPHPVVKQLEGLLHEAEAQSLTHWKKKG